MASILIAMKHMSQYPCLRAIQLISLLLVLPVWVDALAESPERRRDQFGTEFGYYIYPIGGDIPGLGSAQGLGATVLNIGDSDTDFTSFAIYGDFSARGGAFLDMHLIQKRLLLDLGAYDYQVAPLAYRRGMRTSKDDYLLPEAEGQYVIAQLTLSHDDRRYEAYYRLFVGNDRLLSVRDAQGTAFSSLDTSKHNVQSQSIGLSFDLTDDRLDPRQGLRHELSLSMPNIDDPYRSDYIGTDYNLTAYRPFRKYDTLALNLFYSKAVVIHKASTDYTELQTAIGLDCASRPVAEQADCYSLEQDYLNEVIAANKYGDATALGGTQRLRSFANGRFHAGQALFAGAEYRWNMTDEYTPFNIYIAKGIRTGMQLAAFAEAGTVSEHSDDLFNVIRYSVGVGFRAVLSGVIIRADIANGHEGTEFVLFINYPWSMFSVDNPA
jgi:hypothetical protein